MKSIPCSRILLDWSTSSCNSFVTVSPFEELICFDSSNNPLSVRCPSLKCQRFDLFAASWTIEAPHTTVLSSRKYREFLLTTFMACNDPSSILMFPFSGLKEHSLDSRVPSDIKFFISNSRTYLTCGIIMSTSSYILNLIEPTPFTLHDLLLPEITNPHQFLAKLCHDLVGHIWREDPESSMHSNIQVFCVNKFRLGVGFPLAYYQTSKQNFGTSKNIYIQSCWYQLSWDVSAAQNSIIPEFAEHLIWYLLL